MFAVVVGGLLEVLLQSLAHPLAVFGCDFEFARAQRARACWSGVHGPPAVGCLFREGGEPFTPPLWGGAKLRPNGKLRVTGG